MLIDKTWLVHERWPKSVCSFLKITLPSPPFLGEKLGGASLTPWPTLEGILCTCLRTPHSASETLHVNWKCAENKYRNLTPLSSWTWQFIWGNAFLYIDRRKNIHHWSLMDPKWEKCLGRRDGRCSQLLVSSPSSWIARPGTWRMLSFPQWGLMMAAVQYVAKCSVPLCKAAPLTQNCRFGI